MQEHSSLQTRVEHMISYLKESFEDKFRDDPIGLYTILLHAFGDEVDVSYEFAIVDGAMTAVVCIADDFYCSDGRIELLDLNSFGDSVPGPVAEA